MISTLIHVIFHYVHAFLYLHNAPPLILPHDITIMSCPTLFNAMYNPILCTERTIAEHLHACIFGLGISVHDLLYMMADKAHGIKENACAVDA